MININQTGKHLIELIRELNLSGTEINIRGGNQNGKVLETNGKPYFDVIIPNLV